MIFLTVCIQTETARFIMKNIMTAIAANIYSFCPTYFASVLCQELDIFQSILCLSFPLLVSWSTMRKNVYYVTRIFYRLSCLVSLCPSFSPPVVNHLLCKIVVELCRGFLSSHHLQAVPRQQVSTSFIPRIEVLTLILQSLVQSFLSNWKSSCLIQLLSSIFKFLE